MNINGKAYRTIWLAADGWSVEVIDQTRLPHELAFVTLKTMEDAARAILTMQVRGAPLIGATAAYGVCLALRQDASDEALDRAIAHLAKQRPTAINLRWALEEMRAAVRNLPRDRRARRRLRARRRDLRRRRGDQPRHRRARGQADRGDRRAQAAGRARQRAHPLQRRLARLRRPRHGALAHLRGARPRHAAARVGRRDAAAQSGRVAHRLRARRPRRAAHHHRRQCRRAPDAAGAGGYVHRRRRPRHRQRRCRQQDRHLSQGAGGQGQRRAVLRGAAAFDHRLDAGRRARTSRSRSAAPTRC